MKSRRHHNNDGRAQIKAGKTREQVKRIAQRLGLPVGPTPAPPSQQSADELEER